MSTLIFLYMQANGQPSQKYWSNFLPYSNIFIAHNNAMSWKIYYLLFGCQSVWTLQPSCKLSSADLNYRSSHSAILLSSSRSCLHFSPASYFLSTLFLPLFSAFPIFLNFSVYFSLLSYRPQFALLTCRLLFSTLSFLLTAPSTSLFFPCALCI